MELISTSHALQNTFSRLFRTYPTVEFAVAWASANTLPFKALIAKPNLIKRAVIGTHFYQTHPDVMDAFVDSSTVRFIRQPDGVFHPKIYLFSKLDEWEVMIGSANLTSAALTTNAEVMILMSHSDVSASGVDKQLRLVIDAYWKSAKPATKESALAYRAIWLTMQPALKRLSGQYGKGKAGKPPVDSSVMSMSWNQFLLAVHQDGPQHLHERCGLLGRVRSAFLSHNQFSEMDLELRQTIAGMPNHFDDQWGWFGSMKGAGYFKQAINSNSPQISKALNSIPLEGRVARAQYDEYVKEFTKAFANGGHGVATASRLLALKRPDQFVCLDSKNQRELCANFGIKQSGIDYERYWEEVVDRITDAPWWNSPRPKAQGDAQTWDGRAAMLDAIFYRP
jgi:HKD family nuclease